MCLEVQIKVYKIEMAATKKEISNLKTAKLNLRSPNFIFCEFLNKNNFAPTFLNNIMVRKWGKN
jgi:hypothetical protein